MQYRPHNRYSSHDTGSTALSSLDYTHSSFSASGFHSKTKTESRSRHSSSHHHNQYRYTSHHHYSNSHHHSNFSDGVPEEDIPNKRPRLMIDVTRKALEQDIPSSADSTTNSIISSSGHGTDSPVPSPQVSFELTLMCIN